MGAMNDFFGEPLFQPTGTDWIDHAFTAAILDEEETDSDDASSYQPSASAPTPKMTPELREALMKDPKTRDAMLQIEKSQAEISDMIRRAQRRWF